MSQLPLGISIGFLSGALSTPPLGTVVMGSIASEQRTIYESGLNTYNIHSGDLENWMYCRGCKTRMGGSGDGVAIHGVSGLYMRFCWQCAGFTYKHPVLGNGFHQRYDWIMDSIPLTQDTPLPIIADWLEENQRTKDSEYIRKCDEILSSR